MLRYLYLLRHAESKEKQIGQDDIDRKLTPRGMREALLIGTYLYKEKAKVDVIISSPAERAKATAGLVVDGMKWDHKTITFNDELYEASSRTFFNFLFTLDDTHKHIMLVAHNPVVSYVAEYLTKEEIGDMAPGSLATIKFTIPSWKEIGEGKGELENYINPEMLE
jgi:phosphohistidine phosphatase